MMGELMTRYERTARVWRGRSCHPEGCYRVAPTTTSTS